MVPGQMSTMGEVLQTNVPIASVPEASPAPSTQVREDSIDSSTPLVGPDTPTDGHAPDCRPADCCSLPSLSTVE